MLIYLLALLGETCSRVQYTISGMSSGGYMTGQVHVAYSSYISGAGILVAGPYYCAQNSLVRANTICTYNNNPIDVTPLINYTLSMAAQGLIDPVSYLSSTTVYLFSGALDELMQPAITQATYNYYKAFIPESKIFNVVDPYCNHAWPTKTSNKPCWYYGRYYINNCGYDGAGIMLTTLLGPLYQRNSFNQSNLFPFPQKAYADVVKIHMDNYGYIYIPDNCKQDASICRLHVTLHGCGQSYQNVKLVYMLGIGLLEWADSNDIVVIFPQTVNSKFSPGGCWDLDGYNGPDYALKTGGQVKAIHTMSQDYVGIVSNIFK